MATTLYNKATGTRLETDDAETAKFWLAHGYGKEDVKSANKPATAPPAPPPPRKAAAANKEGKK